MTTRENSEVTQMVPVYIYMYKSDFSLASFHPVSVTKKIKIKKNQLLLENHPVKLRTSPSCHGSISVWERTTPGLRASEESWSIYIYLSSYEAIWSNVGTANTSQAVHSPTQYNLPFPTSITSTWSLRRRGNSSRPSSPHQINCDAGYWSLTLLKWYE